LIHHKLSCYQLYTHAGRIQSFGLEAGVAQIKYIYSKEY